MLVERSTTRIAVAFAGSLAFLAPVSTAYAEEPTTIDELVLYGIAHETSTMFRYEFGTDTYSDLGPMIDQFGSGLDEPTALGCITSGPSMGIYTTGGEGVSADHLMKVDPLTMETTRPSKKLGTSGSNWYFLGADKNNKLYVINPADGNATFQCNLSNTYHGLALAADGTTLYGAFSQELWAMDLPALISGDSSAEWKVGDHGYSNVEAAAFCFGDSDGIEALGLSGPWVDNGLLFAFSENDALLILNPATAAAIPYPCSFGVLDFEGLIIVTEAQDSWLNLPDGLQLAYD
jgi:hypothetical protein